MGRRYDTVTLLTDYGNTDEFVGVMKAVVRDIAPHVTTIDLTHEVPPYDVRAGALTLVRSVGYLPEGVVVAVVDPGVGTGRRPLAIEVAEGAGVFVGPDNGLLAPAVALLGGAQRAVVLDNPDYRLEALGPTFDGRDVFAPAAAHLCNGVDLSEFGELADPASLMPAAVPLPNTEGEGVITGQVLWIDHFGNCQLNIGPEELDVLTGNDTAVRVTPLDGTPRVASRVTTFSELGVGAVGLVTDAYGMLALVCDRRSAAVELGLGPGDDIALELITDGQSSRAPGAVAVAVTLPTHRPSAPEV